MEYVLGMTLYIKSSKSDSLIKYKVVNITTKCVELKVENGYDKGDLIVIPKDKDLNPYEVIEPETAF